MKIELQALIKAAKDFKEYQSIGNGAKLNCAIEDAEKAVKSRSITTSNDGKPLVMQSVTVNELRIGNYYYWTEENENKDFYQVGDAYSLHCIDENIEFFKPIVLTEQWIYKLFKFKITDGTTYLFSKDCPIIYFTKKGKYVKTIKKIGVIETKIKYVHELQNLYFALTGRELTVS